MLKMCVREEEGGRERERGGGGRERESERDVLWKLVFKEWYIYKDAYIHVAIVKRFCKCRFNFIYYTFSRICPGCRWFGRISDFITGGGVAKATGRGHVEIDE